MTYAEVRSILVLGDSVSKGVVLNPGKKRYTFSDKGFIGRLTAVLRPKVFDCSKFGSTTAYGLKLLEEKLPAVSPDLVLMEYGSNDCDFKWEEVAADPSADHRPNIEPERYVANLHEMVEKVRGKGGIPVMTNLHPLNARAYFNWFTKNDPQKQESVLEWLGSVRRIFDWQEMYSQKAEQAAAAMDVPLVDIRGAFLKQPDYTEYLCDDGIHPNEKGHGLMEEAFLGSIHRVAEELIR